MATGQTYGPAGMGLAGIASLNQPKFTPRENYIAWSNQGHPDQLHDNKINRIISESQAKQDRWEELGGPGYIIENPKGPPHTRFDAFPTFDNKRNKIVPSWMEAGITNPNLKQLAGLDDVWPWMKDKAWPWMKETGEGMKNQIPYFLDNMVPFYEPPEGYYDPDWEENKDMADLNLQEVMDLYESLGLDLNTDRFIRKANKAGVQVAGMDDSLQYLQRQIDELDRDSPNYDDQLEMLINDMEMKYPWAIS